MFQVCALSGSAPSAMRVVGIFATNLTIDAKILAGWIMEVRNHLRGAVSIMWLAWQVMAK